MDYTAECNNVLRHAEETLMNDFPTSVLTMDYLILSALEVKKSHAFNMLNTAFTNKIISQLSTIYEEIVHKHSIDFPKINSTTRRSEKVNEILERMEKEAKKLEMGLIGSETLILAIFDEKTPIVDFFSSFGITYSSLFDSCLLNSQSKQKPKEKTLPLPLNGMESINVIMKPMQNILESGPMRLEAKSKELLLKYTKNINEYVRNNSMDEIIGRDNEVKQLIKVLARRKKNNAIIIGESGVGKTSLMYKLAKLINDGDVPPMLKDKEIVELDVMGVVSGTTFRGMFEERLKGIYDELLKSKKYIFFIDDMQQVFKTGSKDKDSDMSGTIETVLNNENVRVVGTIGFKDYKNGIEPILGVSRKLQKIKIKPNTADETFEILKSSKKNYEKYHSVKYSDEILKKIIFMADRYITEKKLPDSALDVMDVVGAGTCLIDKTPDDLKKSERNVKNINMQLEIAISENKFDLIDELNEKKDAETIAMNEILKKYRKNKAKYYTEITEDLIRETISDMSGIPVSKLTSDERGKINNINENLKKVIIGQDDAIDSICRSIKRNKVGLSDKTKPIAVSLHSGPTGVGKTLLAKKIAEEVFGSEKNMIRIDMSEFSEKASVAKLMGAPAGYVGYNDSNMLTDKVMENPYSLILLDEIEKANEEVFNLLLQVFDDGRLTDGKGNTVSFKNTIILMTSNIGAKEVSSFGGGIGFVEDRDKNNKSIFEKAIKGKFNPEFINRLDSIVIFNSLSDENLSSIIRLELSELIRRMEENHYEMTYDDTLVNYILSEVKKEKKYGARPIKRFIAQNIEDKIVDLLLDKQASSFVASAENNEIEITKA